MNRVIPDGWDLLPLQNIFTLTSGKAKTKKYLASKSKENPVPVFGGNGINGYCSEAMLTESTVVIGRVGEYCGVVHLSPEISWMTDNALYVKKLKAGFDKLFIFYQLTHASLDTLRSKGGQPLISQAPIYELSLVFPPLPEQQKIAKILTSVDEVIAKTQAQIDKLKDLKTGMMQELLTNGIGHTEFKDSPVGRIPVDWKRVKLGAVSTLITKGSTPTTSGHAYVNSGVRFFRSINASEDGTLRLNDIRFISEEASRAIRRSSLEQGDIVISIVGAKTGRTYFCIENNVHLPANINQNIALIRPSNEVLSSAFLKFVISAQDFQHQVDLEVTTQAQPSLSLKQVGEFEFNLPPITEQVMIAEKLNSLVSGIKLIQDKLQQTKLLKKALMQDLLTGKVRVKVS